MQTLFADIALALPSAGTFQYAIPENMQDQAQVGKRVFASVRTRRMVGYVVGLSHEKLFDEVKPIDGIIDEFPVLSDSFLELTRWLSEYYFCSWGQAIDAALPAPFKKGRFLMKSRTKKMSAHTEIVNPGALTLTPHQNEVYQTIKTSFLSANPEPFLLHGITGSGKTEVYMQIIGELLRHGKGSIVLVPEISLTPQTVDRFFSRFGDQIAIIHSRLSQAHRVEEWHRLRKGQAKIVVGARSAVFSPVQNLGAIIIDEEHDTSYKQGETPRYETRTVAFKRAEIEKAGVILGSATPSLEAFHAACEKKIRILTLPERIEKRPLPRVEVVDMRREHEGKRERIFSSALERNIRESLAKKEQVMVLLNRRGFSTYLHCSSCGYVMSCKNCRISLTYHFDRGFAMCHVCHYSEKPPQLCPGCQKHRLHYFGIGTQKVELEASKLFLGSRIGRMDADSTSKKDSHETILRAFKRGELDILIGTQMIAKGHDFPNVSLIGVISADTALHIPDFRAAERTFDLLTQVAGRAGRGDIPGKVIVQTYVPHHYAIQAAQKHDYASFFAKEIVLRNELYMPPWTHLTQLILSGPLEKEVLRQILELEKILRTRLDMTVCKLLGPAPSVISKEKGLYRWNLFIQSQTIEGLSAPLREALKEFKKSRVTLTVDVDPQ